MSRAVAILGLGAAAFGVALALYVGSHLSNEAMAVLTGALCGAGAMLPAALIAGLALFRQRKREEMARMQPPPQQQPMYPPVIVVAPPAPPSTNTPPAPNLPYASGYTPPPPRRFTVIGDDPIEPDGD